MKPVHKTILWLTAFSVAMGFLETAVVVYLRELLYHGEFSFPVQPASRTVLVTELWRELATIIMLLGVGILAGKTFAQRFVFFLYCFAIWDIFYYVFLKVLLNWPATMLDWDILFLLPVPWVGPVLAPCIISLSMILFTYMVLHLEETCGHARFSRPDWILLVSGSLVVITSFCTDYISILQTQGSNPETDMLNVMRSYIPKTYNWWLFALGQLFLFAGMARIYRVNMRTVSHYGNSGASS